MTEPKTPSEISVIEKTRIPLDPSAELAALQWKTIDFEMQEQCYSNWCWAAVAASVSTFYDNTNILAQCCIANLELHRKDCCDVECHRDDVEFNVIHTLGSSLNRVDCLDRVAFDEKATLEFVQQEIDACRPLCVRTVWSAGGAHFLAIVGYLAGTDELSLADPHYGSTESSYKVFCTNYLGIGGQWTDTYYTKNSKTGGAHA